MGKIGLDSSSFEKGLSGAKSSLSSFGSTVAKGAAIVGGAAVAGLAAATAGTVALGKASIQTGLNFDKAMSQVAATMGQTMAGMQEEVGSTSTVYGDFTGNLREFAMFLGRNTAFSATQAAQALNYTALAGYNVQESMDMLPTILALAAAGNFDLARASDMVTDTQTAFGFSMERTAQLVDEMAKAASTGNTSVEQLGSAYLVVGGLAQELNGGFVTLADGSKASVDGVQEMTIALTAMANAGIKGSAAGTHVRNMIMKLSKPTSDGAKALENMGVKVFGVDGKMRSLADIFGDLNKEMESMTQEEKITTISNLFNARDLASAEALLNAVSQDWNEIGEAILNADGAAALMAETQLDNLAGDITLFKSALEGAQIVISDGLTPELRKFVQFGTSGISRLTDAFQKEGISGAMSTFGDILGEGIGLVISDLPSISESGIELISGLLDGITDNTDVLAEGIQQVVAQIGEFISAEAPALAESASTLLVSLAEALLDPDMLSGLTDSAVSIVISLGTALSDAAPQLIPAAVDAVLAIADALVNNLDPLLGCAEDILQAVADGITNALPSLSQKLPEITQKIADSVLAKDKISSLISAGGEIVAKLLEGISNEESGVGTALYGVLEAIAGGVGTWVANGGLIDAAAAFVNGFIAAVKAIWQLEGIESLLPDFTLGGGGGDGPGEWQYDRTVLENLLKSGKDYNDYLDELESRPGGGGSAGDGGTGRGDRGSGAGRRPNVEINVYAPKATPSTIAQEVLNTYYDTLFNTP